MQVSSRRIGELSLLKGSAAGYALAGTAWALVALYSVLPALRSLVVVGISVPLLLLSAQAIRVQRGSVDFSPILDENLPVTGKRWKTAFNAIIAVDLILILLVSAILFALGETKWIVPAAAILFAFHFYLLPSGPTTLLDMLLASGVVIASVAPTLWASMPGWQWAFIASSACALACWLASDVRLQRALLLFDEEGEMSGAV
jgi:hypothetical protein